MMCSVVMAIGKKYNLTSETLLPIDKALNHKMMDICLKLAPKNPLIFLMPVVFM